MTLRAFIAIDLPQPIQDSITKETARLQKILGNKIIRTVKGDVAAEIRKLKQHAGPDIQVHGSANLIQTLLKHDLVDEFWLKIFPVTIGTGKRLFDNGTIPAAYALVESVASPSGVIIATLKRAGEFTTGAVPA